MKVTREQMAQNRLRILDAASELFREKGFEAVTVAEVMNAAGLTHGGFYGHFGSKEELIAKTLDHALKRDETKAFDLGDYVETYLSPLHRDNPGKGCPTAGMIAGTRHQGAAARASMGHGTRAQIDLLSSGFRGNSAEQRRQAIVSWAAMVGAMMIARGIEDQALSEELLTETREWIKDAVSEEHSGS